MAGTFVPLVVAALLWVAPGYACAEGRTDIHWGEAKDEQGNLLYKEKHEVTYDNDLPHYFPAKEGFAEAVREVQVASVPVMPYINAHLWDTDVSDFKTLARPAAVKSRARKSDPASW